MKTDTTPAPTRLFYPGTKDDVRVGDRVLIKGWLRQRYGTVCYIPGDSPRHREMEYDNIKQWAIRLDDGTILVSLYYPELPDGQRATKGLTLIGRGRGSELLPDERLE